MLLLLLLSILTIKFVNGLNPGVMWLVHKLWLSGRVSAVLRRSVGNSFQTKSWWPRENGKNTKSMRLTANAPNESKTRTGLTYAKRYFKKKKTER